MVPGWARGGDGAGGARQLATSGELLRQHMARADVVLIEPKPPKRRSPLELLSGAMTTMSATARAATDALGAVTGAAAAIPNGGGSVGSLLVGARAGGGGGGGDGGGFAAGGMRAHVQAEDPAQRHEHTHVAAFGGTTRTPP